MKRIAKSVYLSLCWKLAICINRNLGPYIRQNEPDEFYAQYNFYGTEGGRPSILPR